jgi:hypothetical protein
MTASTRLGQAHPSQLSLFDVTAPLRNMADAVGLPKTARDLVDLIGLDATIDLVKMFGGDELHIPEVVDGTSRLWPVLVEAAGRAAAVSLVEHFAGTRVYVPMCRAALLTLRNREIIQRYDAGEPFDAIRRHYKMSRSYLFRVLKKLG